MWTLKLDENGNAVLRDGKPVYVVDGKEVVLDINQTNQTIASLNGEAKSHRERAEAAEANLKKFEGIADPAAALDAIEKLKKVDDKKLVDAGQVDIVRAEATKAVEDKYAPVVEENKVLKAQLRSEKIGGNFTRSKFVEDKVAIPPDLLEAKFGDHFELNDQGEVVGYYDREKKNAIYSAANPGKLADFDEAVEKLIDTYPRKADILKGSGHTGTGALPSGGDGGKNPWKQGATFSLSEQDQIEAKNPQLAARLKAEAGVAS